MCLLRRLIGIWLVLLLCEPVSSQVPGSANTSYGDQLTMGMLIDRPLTLNPFKIHSVQQKEVLQYIFGGGLLKQPDKFFSPPDLVVRYRIQPSRNNYRIWHLELDRGISFHDGRNLRNTDVIFTLELVKKFGGHILNRRLDFSNIKALSGSGDLEVIIELDEPDRYFNLKLSDVPILPADYYGAALSEGYDIFRRKRPLGLGPFRFESLRQGNLDLTYHQYFYGGRPFLDKIKIVFFGDESALVDALANGTIDYLEMPDLDTARNLHALLNNKVAVFTIPRSEVKVHLLLLNTRKYPFNNKKVRQAIELAIDRKSLFQRLMKGYGSQANTLVKRSNDYYVRSLHPNSFKPREALKTLKSDGWRIGGANRLQMKNGKPLSFKLHFAQNSKLEVSIARTIKLELAELDIDVQPDPLPPLAKDPLLENNQFQAMLYSFSYDERYLFEAFEEFYYPRNRIEAEGRQL